MAAASPARYPIPAGSYARRTFAPQEELVTVVYDVAVGQTHASVKYVGGQGYVWTERVENLDLVTV